MAYLSLVKCLVNLRNASVSKKLFVIICSTRLNLIILNLLYDLGYIVGYSCYSVYKIKVFLKYFKDRGVLEHIEIPNRTSTGYFRSYKWLFRNSKAASINYITVLSTKYGILTSEELFFRRLRVGGVILFYISYF